MKRAPIPIAGLLQKQLSGVRKEEAKMKINKQGNSRRRRRSDVSVSLIFVKVQRESLYFCGKLSEGVYMMYVRLCVYELEGTKTLK